VPENHIRPAKLTFNEQGTPVAEDFDDVYFSNDDGLAETEYVFLQHNNLPQRWLNFEDSTFVIAETGFGTGLNFLVAWDAFLKASKSSVLKKLHFVSFEKFPVAKSDLIKALQSWPGFKHLSDQLLSKYPVAVQGCHRLEFDNVTLDLWFADVNQAITDIYANEQGVVDCWFLDGFAPSKNPDMWTDTLFNHMAQLARPQATFATFTAAGFVKRGLAAAGFNVTKPKGFGYKRNMLAGVIATDLQRHPKKAAYYSRYCEQASHNVTIIGGGLAAANTAYALAKRGFNIRIICKDNALAKGASGNHSGGFYPLIHAQHDTVSEIYSHSYLYARGLYDELTAGGFEYAHDWCGTVQVAYNEKTLQRLNKVANNPIFPNELVHQISPERAAEIAGIEIPYPALFYPLAGWINPPSLVTALIKAAKSLTEVEIVLEQPICELKASNHGWLLHGLSQQFDADIVVLANGNHVDKYEQTADLPFSPVRGQVSLVGKDSTLANLKTVLCHKGYATPIWNDIQCIGSSFVKQTDTTDYSTEEQQGNLATLQSCFPKQQWAQTLDIGNTGRAGVRCTSPDHLPIVGAVPNISVQREQYNELYKNKDSAVTASNYSDLYLLSALGSRGLCSAPLMAEILACQLNNEVMPLSDTLLAALNPNRFLIRNLIKNKS
jgi:tRNA 5-methylaminomethyl-2-thiouridine biosynthesis bifunctional protein